MNSQPTSANSATSLGWSAIIRPPLAAARFRFWRGLVLLAMLGVVVGVLVWQGLTAKGNPDPGAVNISRSAVVLDTGILVFREGLEAILVLAALTASLARTDQGYLKPVALGSALSFGATIVTWFVAVGILSDVNAPELALQAATGLLAVLVLLVIMNWFFHKIYWAGWIIHHNRRKNDLTSNPQRGEAAIFRGLLVVGFTSVYREGFEVVLFLQSLRLKAGTGVVLEGALIGLALTGIMALLTFVAHYKLPYRKMLILTGLMLGCVLIVMVGESVQEMQQAHWISTTTLSWKMPDWLNLWFAIYPSVESLASQLFAAVFVIGSYFVARHFRRSRSVRQTDELALME
ncbi:MAG: FTR1 family iron permease [Phycisphaerae bacterium]